MIPAALFGSVTPSWSVTSPGLAWPSLGTATLSGVEGPPGFGAAPIGAFGTASGFGQFNPPALGWGTAGNGLAMAPTPGIPFVMPGAVTAAALLTAIAMRRGQPQGPTSDQDVEEFVYDALELLPGAGEVEVRCDGGRISLTGSVPHRRIKRDIGEIAWAIPGINDVNNGVTITARRRARAFARENEPPQPSAPTRKQS
jgi:hypothetical protein